MFFNRDKKDSCGCESVKNETCGCDSVSSDNACGCNDSARERVRMCDAEIAEDVLASLNCLCGAYAECLLSGCDCDDKLADCEEIRHKLCNYAKD